MLNKIVKWINYINILSFCILTASILFFYNDVMRLSYYLFFITYIIEFVLDKRWQNFMIDKYRIFFIIILTFYFMGLFSYFFDDKPTYFWYIMNRRSPLIAFSIVGLFGLNNRFKIEYFFNSLIVTSLLTILYLLAYCIGLLEFIQSSQKTELLWHSRISNVNDHMMFNFYLNLSLIGCWFFISNSWKSLNLWMRVFYLLSSAILMYIILLSEGRCGVIECLLIISAISLYEAWKRNKILAGVLFAILVGFSVFVTGHHKRMSKEMMVNEPRLFLWQGALNAIKEKPVCGFGLSDAQERFDIERAKIEPQFFKEWAKDFYVLDCHDQYIQSTLEFGIFGLIIILAIFLYPLYCVRNQTRILAFIIIGLCMYQSIFDVFVTGQKANIYCMIVLMLFIENKRKDQEVPQ